MIVRWLHVMLMAAAMLGAWGSETAAAEPPLKVCATIPDLGNLVKEIGGDQVEVTVFAKGAEDPHFLEARPSFIKAASEADLLVEVGLELEVGWVPPIQTGSRNARIQAGAPGLLEAATAISPLGAPTGNIDRSMGDVHASGNPHFLTDPICGLKVAKLIADRLSALRPASKETFESRYADFRARLCAGLVGDSLAKKYDAEKLALLHERGKLLSFLDSQGDRAQLGGWLGQVAQFAGTKAVADHDLWPYFARRYGIEVVGFLEPKPGVSPTTKHLGEVVDLMKRQGVKLILSTPYFDPRHAAFVSKQTSAAVVPLAHQVGSRPGTDDYISMCGYNVRQLALALGSSK